MLTRPDGHGGFISLLGSVTSPLSLHSEQFAASGKPPIQPQQIDPPSGETSLHQDKSAMLINSGNLRTLYTGFSTAFQQGFEGVQPLYPRVAMTVPSATRQNEYGWLGQFPRIREWIGDRIVQNLAVFDYTIKNRSFESTIGVDRDDLSDDMVGIYQPMFSELGRLGAIFPDELVWALMKAGFSTNCYDGQFFFDTDHPRLDEKGLTISWANTDGGNGPAWFLLDDSRAIKPIIYQTRRPFELARMDAATDEVVFNRKEYRYGTDGRCNVGFGFPQMIWGSKQPLDADHYEAARVGLASMKGDYGRPLGLKGSLLVVGPSLEGAARRLLNGDTTGKVVVVPTNTGGTESAPAAFAESNPWKGTADLLVSPWLD